MSDNRTTELLQGAEGGGRMSATDELRRMLDERGVEYKRHYLNTSWYVGMKLYMATDDVDGTLTVDNLTPEQAIAATLGRPKAKAHPYGYEPDTGAFDCTRCECGCINDISATYCNDCGGEIEIDMYAEKEIYHTPRHLVFAEKHDDGSLEFGGKRYVAATLRSGKLTADDVLNAVYKHGACWQAIADELNSRADYHGYEQAAIEAWESIKAWNSRAERDCDYKQAAEYWQRMYEETFAERTCHDTDANPWHFTCSACGNEQNGYELWNYCPNCGCKVVGE